jgi:hypothetical protein
VASLASGIAFGLHLASAAEGGEHRQKVLGRLKGSRGMGHNVVFARRGGHYTIIGYQDTGSAEARSPHLNVDATINGRVSREATRVAGAVVSTALVCNYCRRAERVCAICTRRVQRQRLRLAPHASFGYGGGHSSSTIYGPMSYWLQNSRDPKRLVGKPTKNKKYLQSQVNSKTKRRRRQPRRRWPRYGARCHL